MYYINCDLTITDRTNITGVHGDSIKLPKGALEITKDEFALLCKDPEGYQVNPSTLVLEALADYIKLKDAQALQIKVLSVACKAKIHAGLVSSALGADHRYDTDKDVDQTNLLAAGLGGVDIDYTCIDLATKSKIPRPHTAVQIAQVFGEARDEKVRLVGLYHTLRGQVEAVAITTTFDDAQTEIDAIAWTG